MVQYQCINSFNSESYVKYFAGDYISASEYLKLSLRDRRNFIEKVKQESSDDYLGNKHEEFSLKMSNDYSNDSLREESQQEPESNDYGGGSFGGAGAGSDWNDNSSNDSGSDGGSSSDD